MALEMPTTTTETETENTTTTTFDGERVETYEDYWQAISMVRFLKKACKHYGVAKVKDAGKSPWADHFVHFAELAYGEGNTYANRDDPDGLHGDCLDLDGNLPIYKDEFETPEWEYTEVSPENADDFVEGFSEQFADDEDPIFVPDSYENPTVIYYETAEEGEAVDDDTVTATLTEVSGIGEARAAEALEALKDAGMAVTWK